MQPIALSYIAKPVLHSGQARVFGQTYRYLLPPVNPCMLSGVGVVISIIAFQAVV